MEKARTYKKATARPYRKGGKRKSRNIFSKKNKPVVKALLFPELPKIGNTPLAIIGAELYYRDIFLDSDFETRVKKIYIDPVTILDMKEAGKVKTILMNCFKMLYLEGVKDWDGYSVKLIYNREPEKVQHEENEHITYKKH